MPRHRPYPAEFRRQMVDLVRSGRTPRSNPDTHQTRPAGVLTRPAPIADLGNVCSRAGGGMRSDTWRHKSEHFAQGEDDTDLRVAWVFVGKDKGKWTGRPVDQGSVGHETCSLDPFVQEEGARFEDERGWRVVPQVEDDLMSDRRGDLADRAAEAHLHRAVMVACDEPFDLRMGRKDRREPVGAPEQANAVHMADPAIERWVMH